MRASNLKMPMCILNFRKYTDSLWVFDSNPEVQTLWRDSPFDLVAMEVFKGHLDHFTIHSIRSQINKSSHIQLEKILGFPCRTSSKVPTFRGSLGRKDPGSTRFRGDFLPLSSWREGHLDPANLSIHIADKNENHNRICCIQNTRNINISKIYHSSHRVVLISNH